MNAAATRQDQTIGVTVTPDALHKLAELAEAMRADPRAVNHWSTYLHVLEERLAQIQGEGAEAARAEQALRRRTKAKKATKEPSPTESRLEMVAPGDKGGKTSPNVVTTLADVYTALHTGYTALAKILRATARPPMIAREQPLKLAPDPNEPGFVRKARELDDQAQGRGAAVARGPFLHLAAHEGALLEFVSGLLSAEQGKGIALGTTDRVMEALEKFYQELHERHTTDGVSLQAGPLATDAALLLLERVEADEIDAGKPIEEISPFSARRAETIVDAVTTRFVGETIEREQHWFGAVVQNLRQLWRAACDIEAGLAQPTAAVRAALRRQKAFSEGEFTADDFDERMEQLEIVNPNNLRQGKPSASTTAMERHALGFKNATVKGILHRVEDGEESRSIVDYIYARKIELRDYYRAENTFFVCKTSAGNTEKGIAPGAIEVIPGERPTVKIDTIAGSGFAEVVTFIQDVESSVKHHDLIVATSPDGAEGKNNCLLVGPPGCGKSQALRAVGGDTKSIGVFATGSDFLTAWKGEAEKNPKRLFLECVRLARENGGKHVHLLIDEIDAILRKPEPGKDAFGGVNLVTEFQNLMDGVVAYPNISVWGATNFPEKIPTAVLRRFSTTLIVGELSLADRVRLLQHNLRMLPVADGFRENQWNDLAEKLDGAVGDVIRKVCATVRKKKLATFLNDHPKEAETIEEWLRGSEGVFDIQSLTPERRAEFLDLLKPHVSVTPADILSSIKMHLDSVAIDAEIKDAKKAYAAHKEFLKNVKQAGAESSGLIIVGGR